MGGLVGPSERSVRRRRGVNRKSISGRSDYFDDAIPLSQLRLVRDIEKPVAIIFIVEVDEACPDMSRSVHRPAKGRRHPSVRLEPSL
jgi:hypothetical protein